MPVDAAARAPHRRNAIPVLYTRGTHYDVGYDVGRTFRGLIEDFLDSFDFLQESLLPAYATAEGRAAYEAGLAVAKKNFPQYVREIQGTADGARVKFHHLMLLHLGRQVLVKNQSPKGNQKPPHGCSSVCSNYEGTPLLGHTEDALSAVLNHIYIVSAHITEEEPQGIYGTKNEGFTSLCYAGYLPGFCMSYNHHGFVFSINVLFPTNVQADRTAPYFITRALLAARTLEEAQKILRDPGVGAGDGFSVNMSFTRQEGSILFHNAEVAPPLPGLHESQISVLTVNTGEHLMHTNKYLRLDVDEDKEYEDESSTHRLQRAQCCQDPDSKTALLELLSDTQDEDYPIFRSGNEDVYTVTVGVFDLREKTWSVYMKKPRACDQLMSLPLVFKWNS